MTLENRIGNSVSELAKALAKNPDKRESLEDRFRTRAGALASVVNSASAEAKNPDKRESLEDRFRTRAGALASVVNSESDEGGASAAQPQRATPAPTAEPIKDKTDKGGPKFIADRGAVGGLGGWSVDQFEKLPFDNTWQVVHESAQGWINGAHDRIERDHKEDGLLCYEHRVEEGEAVVAVSSMGPPLPVDFSKIDRVLMRGHMKVDVHSGRPGKHFTLMLGTGYHGDKVRKPSKKKLAKNPNAIYEYVQFVSDEEAFGSPEGHCGNVMHPAHKKSADGTNGIRLFCTHAASIPDFDKRPGADNKKHDGEYYGDSLAASKPVPLEKWMCIDTVADRKTGWSLYLDGVLVGTSKQTVKDVRIMDDWDACKALFLWHRHMYGGVPQRLLPWHDQNECFGGFSLLVA